MSCALSTNFTTEDAEHWDCYAHHPTRKECHKKRLVVCCDGTWNNSNSSGVAPTNVARLATVVAQKCCNGMSQVVYYHRGVGTEENFLARFAGGLFGAGVFEDIKDTYRFICDNYSPGDEIVIVGFSRGAFTARSVAGMVCTIGLLNSLGLANFGAIFEDYKNFANWDINTKFDPENHLKCFNLTNYNCELEKEVVDADWCTSSGAISKRTDGKAFEYVRTRNETAFKSIISSSGGDDKLQNMANAYRKHLARFKMIHCVKEHDAWVPEEIIIKAIGCWDTVGSLGFPKLPLKLDFFRRGRNPDELRFASLDVHPRIEHAFHALALDEWRTMFQPTLWGKSEKNTTTHLRQVWFPGSHSDVGGGVEGNQQIATISLAWMADQLMSVGVEFVPEEMERIFRRLDFGVEHRKWALGKIGSPDWTTGLPNRTWDTLTYPYNAVTGKNTRCGTRIPGSYHSEEDHKIERLGATRELIHPSVRVRYLYGGKDLDDDGDWACVALTSHQNGYELGRTSEARPTWAKGPEATYDSMFRTMAGDISSIRVEQASAGPKVSCRVPKQLPFEETLYKPEKEAWSWETQLRPQKSLGRWSWGKIDSVNGTDAKAVGEGSKRWAWMWKPRPGSRPKSEGQEDILHEERIGMWERLFMQTNKSQIEEETRRQELVKEDLANKDANAPKPGLWEGFWDGAKKLGSSIVEGVAAAPGNAGRAISKWLPPAFVKKDGIMALIKGQMEEVYGFHDFASWQYGDLRKRIDNSRQ